MPHAPNTSKESGGQWSKAELDSRFSEKQLIVYACMVAVGIVFVWSTHAAFVWLNQRIANADGPAYFRESPQTAIWWFFPGSGALALSWEITLQIWSLAGHRKEVKLFREWTIHSPLAIGAGGRYGGLDSTKVLRWMAVLIVLPIGIFTALALPMHTSLRENDIRECGYAFAGCATYAYADARRMTVVAGYRDSEGKINLQAGIVIDFTGGRRWSSADQGEIEKSVDPAMAEFLEKKTHLPLNFAESERDIPPWDAKP